MTDDGREPGWWVELVGTADDLNRLSGELRHTAWKLVNHEDRYYLRSPDLDAIADPSSLRDEANRLLDATLMAATLSGLSLSEIKTGNMTQVGGDGSTGHLVVQVGAVLVTTRVGSTSLSTNGDPPGPSPMEQDAEILVRIELNDSLREALGLYRKYRSVWAQLSKIIEVARDDAGVELLYSWVPKKRVEFLERCAQYPATAGITSRHARPSTQPPANPMSLQEAQKLIATLLRSWIRHVAGEEG